MGVALLPAMRTFIGFFLFLHLALIAPARADWLQVLPGPADRVVASASHVAVLRGHEVWLLREDGSVAARVGRRDEARTSSARRDPAQEAEEILDVLEVADADRDTDWARDLLDDERTLARRRAAQAQPRPAQQTPPAAPALAAGANDIWMVGASGVLRFGADGVLVREHGPKARVRAVAAAANGLLVARPDGLGFLPAGHGEERFVFLPTPADKVAQSADGRLWAYATAAGLVWTDHASHTRSIGLSGAVLDLAYCGETLLALLADSIMAIAGDGAPELRARDLRAHRLLCPADPRLPWLALGRSLLASFDEARHWQEVAPPAGLAPKDIAVTRRHLWLATSAGLFRSSPTDGQPAAESGLNSNAGVRKTHRRPGARAWFAWLPKVSVRAATVRGPAGHEVEALAFAQFPLDPRQLPIVTAAVEETAAAVPEAATSRRRERALDLADPDRDCLAVARSKAVAAAMTEPERAASYVSRAGRAAWLPELRVLVARRYGRSESLDLNSSSTALSSPLGIDTVNDIRYEARATWDLAKLVFAPEELAAQNQALHMAELRRDIESTMNRLYFERRRLALDIAGADAGTRQVRMTEIDAELDSLSAGAFAACRRDRSP
jgi:hypothetical protein